MELVPLPDVVQTVDDAIAYVKDALDPDSALQYVRDHFTAFRGVGSKIVATQHAASQARVQALNVGRQDVATDLLDRINWLGSLDNFYGGVLDQIDTLNGFLTQFGLPQLGQIELSVAGVALVTAIVGGMMYVTYHLGEQTAAVQTQQHVLDLVGNKVITPDQGVALSKNAVTAGAQTGTSILSSLTSGILGPAVLLGAAVFFLPDVLKSLKGARR
jgi:hypothetical protein